MQYYDLFGQQNQNSAYNRNYNSKLKRVEKMRIIEDLYRGYGYKYFKSKFVNTSSAEQEFSDEELKVAFTDRNYMYMVVSDIVSYCPTLETINYRTDEQFKVWEAFKEKNNWINLLEEQNLNFELKGENFVYLHFETQEDTIPKYTLLKPECMVNIVKDENDNPKYYIYREWKNKEEIDFNTGNTLYSNGRYVTMIFAKGVTYLIDPFKLNTEVVIENQIVKVTSLYFNRDSMKDMFAVFHIAGKKKQSEDFSDIPASYYVDDCINISKETTNLNQINVQLGFPIKYLIDGAIVKGKLAAGSHIYCKSDRVIKDKDGKNTEPIANPFQMDIKDFQIDNDLNTIFKSLSDLIDALYVKAGLIKPSLETKFGSTDSSRVIQQLNSRLENKISLYTDQLVYFTKPIIKILMIENKVYDEELDYNISLIKPTFILRNTPFDKQLYNQGQINSELESKEDIMKKEGLSLREIEEKKDKIKEENSTEIVADINVQNVVEKENNIARDSVNTSEEENK